MELGKIQLNGDDSFSSGRRYARTDTFEPTDSFYNDFPRLILLLFMLLAGIAGWYVKANSEKPERLIAASVDKMISKPFSASLEGSVFLKSFVLGTFRSRQRYSPETGLEIVIDRGYSGGEQVPFNAQTALEALLSGEDIVEDDREDMYGHGTRHFRGAVSSKTGSGSPSDTSFEFWIDIKTGRAVRLTLLKSEPSSAFDDSGHAVPKKSYLNIWYRD